jgi:serine/threonine-protein kinase
LPNGPGFPVRCVFGASAVRFACVFRVIKKGPETTEVAMHWSTVAESASRKRQADEGQTTELFGSAAKATAGTRAGASRPRRREASRHRRIGPYRLFRKLGEGGMGAVYLAGRADDQFRHQVTVKLIKNGTDNEGIVRRFCNERQILAALHHPHIARLLDGGTADDGAPYFVMEYVEGEPIDQYCDHHKLSIEARLRLFRKVCSAVQYAHQNLVVHRDIKPGNILVDAEGEPKLLDFGVAKLLNSELGGQTIALTGRDLMRFMSLPYASPEQILGRPISTASDVYSLGVLLYELLTGHRPYRFEGRSLQEIERAICESEPEKPSTAGRLLATTLAGPGSAGTRPRRQPDGKQEPWRRKLSGDLDNIILKAMRKEPRRRYSSADELSEDLRNYLRGLPVNARPNTLGYRTGKFVRRNKLLAAFVSALFAFAVAMTWLWIRVLHERDIAVRERSTTQQVLSFMMETFNVADPGEARGETILAREILDRGAERIARELNGQPEVQATLLNTIGQVYGGLGLYDRAVQSLDDALEIRRRNPGENSLEFAESLSNLASMLLYRAELDRAEPLLRQALDLRRELAGEESVEVAECLHLWATLLAAKGEYQAAEPLFRRALEFRSELLGEEHIAIAESLNDLATLLRKTGRYSEAEEMFRKALRLFRALKGDEYPNVAVAMSNLAGTLREQGQYRAAAAMHRQALELRRKILGVGHPQVAYSLHNLATTLYQLGECAEAIPLIVEALELWRKQLGERHPHVGMSLTRLAELQLELGDLDEAELHARQAQEILSSALPADHPWIYDAQSALGACLARQKRYPEAEPLLLGVYDDLQRTAPGRGPRAPKTLKRLVDLYEAWGKPDKAAEYRALLEAAPAPSS